MLTTQNNGKSSHQPHTTNAFTLALRDIKARKARVNQAQAVGNGQRYTLLSSDNVDVLIEAGERVVWWQMLVVYLLRKPAREPKTLPFPQARATVQMARIQ